ncbi:preprotein translocase subunit SecA [Patescibacteria group bacterium]
MFGKLFDSNEKQLKKLQPLVDEINALGAEMEKLSEAQVKEKTKNWKNELAEMDYNDQQKYLDKIMVEAFALVKEATKRTQSITLHDVQLMAGITLHQGKITEQKTGEGKTNTATLPLYLNSLTGSGTHLVTPNDYLSRHGAGWMGPVYDYLGVTVGCTMQEKSYVFDPKHESHEFKDEYAIHFKKVEKPDAYRCDITYGTNHEFGFDYLRDNMVYGLDQMSQTTPNGQWGIHNFAIVDEVDSILIDVARTPLIISTSYAQPTERYRQAADIVRQLIKDSDYEVEEKYKNASLTDLGIRRVEKLLGVENLYEQDFEMVHLIEQTLRAHTLYEKDKDYVVQGGKVIVVDQFTGRILPNNRFSQGVHQALEAKESVSIQEESRTMAEISYQNYFRMYKKLAGMTGTAMTEAEEFYKIYKLDVVAIPTNDQIARIDQNDVVYKTEAAKFKAAADDIEEKYKKGQPVLVGTTSVEKSQLLHSLLQRRKIPHEILNAKNHEKEALIISQAGKKHAVTVSTNMAGRGVDIKLGGDPATSEEKKEIMDLGGLHVVGTERHESRRIDNQLRGRSGRQGEPGSSRFYVSLQDDLMRVFGGAQVENLMNRFGIDESIPMEAGIVTKAIENSQKKVEGFNFDRRKQTVEMDDVINVHRQVVYQLRRRVLEMGAGDETHKDWFIKKVQEFAPEFTAKKWDEFAEKFGKEVWLDGIAKISLPIINVLWMEHLVVMDQLREGVGMQAYAQKTPMVEYKREGHERFEMLVSKIYSSVAERLLAAVEPANVGISHAGPTQRGQNISYQKGEFESGVGEESSAVQAQGPARVQKVESGKEKVGRNDPCPCGSGKKFKRCHGANA